MCGAVGKGKEQGVGRKGGRKERKGGGAGMSRERRHTRCGQHEGTAFLQRVPWPPREWRTLRSPSGATVLTAPRER